MINWEEVEYKDEFGIERECLKAEHGLHTIYVHKIDDIGQNLYEVRWFRGALLTIKQGFTAGSWDTALNYAVVSVYNYLQSQTEYWRDLKTSFMNWKN